MTWIRSNKKPSKFQHVDVVINLEGKQTRKTDCSYDGKRFCESDHKGSWLIIENVTHWRPLPELLPSKE